MGYPLYLFNPESDLALADNSPTYLPPNRIVQMSSDLSSLPHWYAPKGSYTSIEEMILSKEPPSYIEPWGWNKALIHRLKKSNIPEHLYPNEQELECIRTLSHRATAIKTLHLLLPNPFFCGCSIELRTLDEIHTFAISHSNCLLKAPWSGSGKGLCFVHQKLTAPQVAWCHKLLKQQKSIIAEPIYNKESDFAMEFHADQRGNIRFAGYSLFFTDTKGAYQGNLVASNEAIISRLSLYIPPHLLNLLKQNLLQILPNIINEQYTGYFGIDMMICKFAQPPIYRIHPCVELNLRMTMGMVARRLFDKHLANDTTGHFLIQYSPQPTILFTQDEHLKHRYPLQQNTDKKIKSGYLALTPATPHTHYQARLFVNSKK